MSQTISNKQLYVDIGMILKNGLRSITIGLAIAYAMQQEYNGFRHNTHFHSIYVTCIFVATMQSIVGIFVIFRNFFYRNILFMIELFVDFFSFAIAALIGSIATARCEMDTPVKPCYHALMRAPLIGCTVIGTLCFVIFTLTMLKK